MLTIDLLEYYQSGPYVLTAGQRDALRDVPSLTVIRADPEDGEAAYHLAPGSTVGAVEFGDLSVLIEPKIGIPKLLSMAVLCDGRIQAT